MRLGRLALARGTLDRAAHRRHDAQWLAQTWADPGTQVVVVDDGQALVRFSRSRSGVGVGGCDSDSAAVGLVLVAPAGAPDGPRLLLGVDADDVAYYAVMGPLPAARAAPGDPHGWARRRAGRGEGPPSDWASAADGVMRAGLRQVGALLDDRDAGLLTHAVALANWHRTHGHCPRCGAATRLAAAGHMRVCPRDGSEHFPRVDPAVIMLVLDRTDRCLLARNENWPPGRLSILAGFVEPGESLEQAVAREVREEVGIEVTKPRYLGSQPWPLPKSLMLGFCARAVDGERGSRITVDGTEIAEARWYSRDDLRTAVATGEILLSPSVSIAYRLIEAWYGSPLPTASVAASTPPAGPAAGGVARPVSGHAPDP